MNINALLSPADSPARDSSSSPGSPASRKARPAGGKAATSALSQEVRLDGVTSDPSSAYHSPAAPHHAFAPRQPGTASASNFRPLQPTPTSKPSSTLNSPTQHYGPEQSSQRPLAAHRPSSTPQMETLADLASMQQRQQTTRAHSANSIPQNDTSTRAATLINPTAGPTPPLFRNSSGKSLADLTMAEAPAQTPPPRTLESSALSDAESNTVTDLLSHLAENSYAYDSHVELINLLHKGFIAHTTDDGEDLPPRDARTYNLLNELRQAREAMDTRFAVGEDIWADWLHDEIILATSSEERIDVTQLCQKAVQDDPVSVKLWQIYVDWALENYAACHDKDGADMSKWNEEDKEVCRELFTRDMVFNVLEQATAATQWRVDESHVLWNKHAELVNEDMPDPPKKAEIERVRDMYVQRLQIPHTTWNETAQALWSIVSNYDPGNWEAIMAEVNEMAAPAKRQMGLREEHELNLRRAVESGDKAAAFTQFSQYLDWERKHGKKNKKQVPFDNELRCALYERALLNFPTYADWWLDYIDFVTTSNIMSSILPLIERATRHCPWSGDLWARRILQSDVENRPHEDVEATKHRATNSGLLDIGGMEELVKVLQQWCSYLRRHAFRPHCSEDDLDTAEVGITMALEDIQQAGRQVYGKDFHGDPLFRLESIHIKFLSESRRFDDARAIYNDLTPHHKHSYEFWSRWYHWELWIWGHQRLNDAHRVETADNGPDRATAVLQQGVSQRGMDLPDKFLNLYMNHFQQHESGEKLRSALMEAREFSKGLQIRRAKEAEEAAVQQEVYQTAQVGVNEEVGTGVGEKRKRDEENLTNGHAEKKPKTGDGPNADAGFGEPSGSASAQIKRDREHNTVTVRNLPVDVQELDIKKFFRDVGTPLSISILADNSGETATATVEFESHDDVLAAKTRNGKDLNGHEVRIHGGGQNTMYVANYPPEYDEAAIRKLFEGYGEILSVRFPSLKYNSRRRFCYVQFLTTEMARATEEAMDGKMLAGSHKLVAKISDPDAKKQRSGAQAEGRELFVKNIEREAPEHEIKAFFEQYGTVVSMNVIKLVSGKRTGSAFIVFSSPDEATTALEANNKPFHNRILHVEISTPKGRAAPLERARKEDVIVKHGGASASPEAEGMNGRRGSDVSMTSSSALQQGGDESWKTAKERKVAIFHLPDTVNDARVRAAMEEYGPLVKIQMRRQDGGAIVEFANVQDAFRVRQGVDCGSLGADVRTGDVGDLLAQVRKRQGGGDASAASGGSGGRIAPPASISRPSQRGGRRGGGLGYRSKGAFGAGQSGEGENAEGSASSVKGGAKTNAEFRNMFVKGKEGAPPASDGA